MSKHRIGMLTGGGDVPGLNACMRAMAVRAFEEGHEVVGIRRGWAGLVELVPDDAESRKAHLWQLGYDDVRRIDRTGGTFLHTSRTNPLKMRRDQVPEHLRDRFAKAGDPGSETIDITDAVVENTDALELDYLITIGGDDTLSVSVRLDQLGVPIVAIPKTMDNDVNGTDYCIGFSTAVTRSVDFISDLRTPMGSHERIGVVELFGRYSGETALMTGLLAHPDRTIIAEVPFSIDTLARMLVEDKYANPSRYSLVVISEGARLDGGEISVSGDADAFGHRRLGGIADLVGGEIKSRTGEHVLIQRLTYLMRAGAPDSLDRTVANNFGSLAMELVQQGRSGEMVSIQRGCYTTVPVRTVTEGKRSVNVDAFYDTAKYRPKVFGVRGKPMFLY